MYDTAQSAINLASIANALGVSMEYLVGLSDEPEIEKLFRGSKYPISDAMLPWLLDKAAQQNRCKPYSMVMPPSLIGGCVGYSIGYGWIALLLLTWNCSQKVKTINTPCTFQLPS